MEKGACKASCYRSCNTLYHARVSRAFRARSTLMPREAHHLRIKWRLTPANCAASGTVARPRVIISSTARFASGSFLMFTNVN